MKYWMMSLTLLLSLAPPCVLCPCAADPGHASDSAAIQQVLAAYENAWNRHDAQAFSQIFAPDAEFVNVRGIDYPGGRAGIERAHRPLFAGMFKGSHVMTDRVLLRFVRPDVATADVYWRMTGSQDRSGQPRGLVQGLRSMVLTRDGGHWQIVVFHNMELPAPPPAGVLPPRPTP